MFLELGEYKRPLILSWIYYIFLFAVLSFGRAFSVLHFQTPFVPVFVTEVLLAFSIPAIAVYIRTHWTQLNKFNLVLFLYFMTGAVHLSAGLLAGNMFAVRDIVFFVYILFLPLTLLVFNNKKSLKWFLIIVAAANVFALLLGRFVLVESGSGGVIGYFVENVKGFNLGICYVTSMLFIASFYDETRYSLLRLLLIVLMSLNLYMVFMLGVRAVWVSVFIGFCYMLIALKKRFIKFVVISLPVLLLVFTGFGNMDSIGATENVFDKIFSRAVSVIIFVGNVVHADSWVNLPENSGGKLNSKSRIGDPDFRTGFDNIIWRLRVWRDSLVFGLESPLWGRGFGVYPVYNIWGYKPPEKVAAGSGVVPAHNHLISVFLKMGLWGLVLFLCINVNVACRGWQSIRNSEDDFVRRFTAAALGAFICWHVVALMFDVIDSPPTSVLLWVFMGLILSVEDINTVR